MLDIFITGSNINAGKTFITAGLAATMQSLGYSTGVYKPVETGVLGKNGFMQSSDLLFIKNIDPYVKTFSTYLLSENASPAIAAENENIIIDRYAIKKDYEAFTKGCDCTIVESTGGIMTPLGPEFLISDLAKALNLPVVIVIKPDSGVINQTLLTINHAVSKVLNVRGVIINSFPEAVNDINLKTIPRLIEEYSDAKILGVVKEFQDPEKINPSDLITNILNGIDIESVFDVNISKLGIE